LIFRCKKGQESTKKVHGNMAVGGNIISIGPPGAGKTMLKPSAVTQYFATYDFARS
jgi:predicted ATPase with chaperone activity